MKTVCCSFVIAAVVVLLVGCTVQSVHPFYTKRDVVYEPALLGKWTAQDEDNYHWVFERSTKNSYKLTISKGTNSSAFEVSLFKLKGQYFLDGCELNDSDYLFSPHHLLMVRSLSPRLEVVVLDIDWLKEYLEENPHALKHTLYSRGDSSYLLLTAETSELQKFIGKHFSDPKAWMDGKLKFEKVATR